MRAAASGLPAPPGGEQDGRVHEGRAADGSRDGVRLLDQGLRRGEVARVDVRAGPVGEGEGEDGEGAGIPGGADVADRQLVPDLVLPELRRVRHAIHCQRR